MVPGQRGQGALLRHAGVVGNPAAHSLSPAIHRAGYAAVGLDWDYEAFTVTPADLEGFVRERCADPAWAGLSVTAPHKEAILAFGEPDEPTRLLGAGNTLVFDGGAARIYNTDVPGFVRAWRAHRLAAPSSVAIVGNGATARSIMLAVAGLGAHDVTLVVRDPARATTAAALGRDLGLAVGVQLLGDGIEQVDLVANTIPAAATAPHAEGLAAAAGAVFDVVYDPWPTPLGQAAQLRGIPGLNGLDLLAGQAVDQFFLLTGSEVSYELCRSAAGRELSRRAAL